VSSIAPIKKQVIVRASQQRAFEVFTEGIDRWWPREHNIGQSPLKREVLEPGNGGRWYAINEDGSECDIGKVLVWEPPLRLIVTWQINADWQYDATFVTEIEVRFTAQSATQTRVELEHRKLDSYGARAEELREVFDSENAWMSSLSAFAAVAGEL